MIERKKQIQELTLATENAKIALLELLNPQSDTEEGVSRPKLEKQDKIEPLGPVTGLNLSDLKDFIDIEQGLLSAARQIDLDEQLKNANAKTAIAEEEFRARQELLFASADGLMAFGELMGQETGRGKGLAAAGALINTYASIAGQLKAFAGVPIPGYAIAQAIATGLVGFAAVKNIYKVDTESPNTTSSFDIGRGNTTAPTLPQIRQPDFNVVGNTGINQLADIIAEKERTPMRAYVVSEDVQSAGELDRRIESTASIG